MKTIFDFNKMIGDSSQGEIIVCLLFVIALFTVALLIHARLQRIDKARRWPSLTEVGQAKASQLHLWNLYLPQPKTRAQLEVLKRICNRSAELIIEKPRQADESSARVRMQQAEAIKQSSAMGNVYMPEDHGCF